MRLLTKSLRNYHTDPVFVTFDILKLRPMLNFEVCKFIHRHLYKNKISNLTPRSLDYSYNTPFNTDFSFSRVRSNLAANFVLHEGVKMYNSLPIYLKCINDFQKFEGAVKSYLLTIQW